jgi:hypothetical protein
MESPDAFTESLAYPQVKRRAVASRSYRTKIASSNNTTFSAGATINIDLPSNLSATYVNWNQCYLKFKVASNNDYALDKCGAAGFISRVQCQTSGAQIFDLPNWNVLMSCLMDTDTGSDYKGNNGNILMGTRGDAPKGDIVTAARTFCVPFVLHPLALSTPHRLTPLFALAPIQFRITLEEVAKAIQATGGTTLTFSDVELICMFTELSPNAQSQVDQMTGGLYNILCSSYQNVGSTMGAGAQTVTSTLGLSVSSLERLILCQRPTTTTSAAGAFSLGNRQKNDLQSYQFFINGEGYPARPVLVEDKGAEAFAEFLLSDHSLVNFDKSSSLQNAVYLNAQLTGNVSMPVGYMDGSLSSRTTALADPYSLDIAAGTNAGDQGEPSNIGSFISAVEMDFLADGKSERLYGGVSTIGSTVTYRGVYGGNAAACQLDFFAQFTVLLSLNMRGTGVWSISV